MHANPYSTWPSALLSSSSFFSALPVSATDSQPPMIPFTFELNPNILNCTVTGPHNKVYYRIVTNSPKLGITFIHDAHGSPIVVVEWDKRPVVEIRGVIPKQHISHWLSLTPPRTARAMTVSGKRYVWAPGDGDICLFDTSVSTLRLLAKVTPAQKQVSLELSPGAIQRGLIEAVVVATVLLLSGRSLD